MGRCPSVGRSRLVRVKPVDDMEVEVALKIIRDSVDGEKYACLLRASRLMGGYIAGGFISEDEGIRLLENEISLKNIKNRC